LTPEEIEIVKMHPVQGQHMLQNNEKVIDLLKDLTRFINEVEFKTS